MYTLFSLQCQGVYTQNLEKSWGQKKNPPIQAGGWQRPIFPGAAPAVSSELEGLTTVFGMGTVYPFRYSHQPTRMYTRAHEYPGGDEGIRTPDLCRAKAALSQLSYVPP